jgi:hypothetical protein
MKFKNEVWTSELVKEWLPLWEKLWKEHSVRWEWQLYDIGFIERGRRMGVVTSGHVLRIWSEHNHNPIPLPSWSVIQDMAEAIYSAENRKFYNKLYDFSQRLAPPNDFS